MKQFFKSKLFKLIWSLGLALILFLICPDCFSKTTIAILLGVELLLINGSSFISRLPWLTHISRVLVGCLFIFSGFIKANDTLGFSYKLEEYVEVFKADSGLDFFEMFAHISLPLAMIVCASEIILGIFLLIGYKKMLTLWLLLAQIVFFTFLTFYSACYNKVTHCGCFGDFLQLKPWESFWKDIALMVLITLLFAGKDNIKEFFSPMLSATLSGIGVILSIWFPIYTYRNLPIFDFRPYAVGMNINKNMEKGPTYKDPVYETKMVYEKIANNAEKKEMTNDEYMASKIWEDTLVWQFDTMVTNLVAEAVNPPKITDFNINSLEGDNVTELMLHEEAPVFWLLMYDLAKTESDEELHSEINDFYKLAQQSKVKMVALTASGPNDIDKFKHDHNALYDFVTVDATVLKTMLRSNPGLMLVKNGTIMMKWHHNNFPTFSEAIKKAN
ncbi:MAG: BT_3928 family protein [Bacteroidia bacterium]